MHEGVDGVKKLGVIKERDFDKEECTKESANKLNRKLEKVKEEKVEESS